MKVSIVLPESQKHIITTALNNLSEALRPFETDLTEHVRFDILVLKSLLSHEVTIGLSKESYESFTHNHGVDFPEYTSNK
jgi:hypothetical protein